MNINLMSGIGKSVFVASPINRTVRIYSGVLYAAALSSSICALVILQSAVKTEEI